MNARRPARSRQHAPAQPAWAEAGAALDREVHGLPARQRDAFVLCALAGAGQGEAARQLGVRERTVRARLARARARLAEALGEVSLPCLLAALDVAGVHRPRVPRRLAAAAVRRAAEQIRGVPRSA